MRHYRLRTHRRPCRQIHSLPTTLFRSTDIPKTAYLCLFRSRNLPIHCSFKSRRLCASDRDIPLWYQFPSDDCSYGTYSGRCQVCYCRLSILESHGLFQTFLDHLPMWSRVRRTRRCCRIIVELPPSLLSRTLSFAWSSRAPAIAAAPAAAVAAATLTSSDAVPVSLSSAVVLLLSLLPLANDCTAPKNSRNGDDGRAQGNEGRPPSGMRVYDDLGVPVCFLQAVGIHAGQ